MSIPVTLNGDHSHVYVSSVLLAMTVVSDIATPNIMRSDSFRSQTIHKPSPYAHLFGTTVSFSTQPEDLTLKDELAGFIGVVDEEIAECERRVDGLRADLMAAEQELAAAKTFRDLHVSILPPIHTLPSEVLTKVFKMVVGCDLTSLRGPAIPAPSVLRSVCKYWRRTAESEKRLWCCFDISAAPDDPTSVKTDTRELSISPAFDVRLTETLRLSGSQKLDFCVNLQLFHFPSPVSSANASVALPPSLKELFANAARWRRVTFYNIGRVFSCLPRVGVGDLDGLEHLSLKEIWDTNILAHDYDPTALAPFESAPELNSLWITVPSRPMVLNNFRSLSYLYLDWQASRVLLSYRFIATYPTQLKYYHEVNGIGFEGIQSSLIESEPTILLPRLHYLRLSGIDILFRLQCPLLNRLILPALESTESVDRVVDFINRSSPQSLERVRVRVPNQVRAHITSLFPAIPSLQKLTIEAQCSMWLLLSVLQYLATELQVVPLLQSIDLRLNLQSATLSKQSAVELLQHVFTRAQNSKLDQFSLQLYTNAQSKGPSGVQEAPIYDGGPNSHLSMFLSVFREADVPGLDITVMTKLRVLK
ncbi:hypothetical protein CPB85DRAFT_994211 [Mucidula mucida]|nr:hypothetical protein CPB85DRAFT_994211 [Mucidula mucida]